MPHTRKPTRGRYQKPWHDGKAPDGFTVNGWRKVCKGGYVRFAQGKHYHDRLASWVGMWVFVEIDDPWGLNVVVFPEIPWNTDERMRCMNHIDWNAGA